MALHLVMQLLGILVTSFVPYLHHQEYCRGWCWPDNIHIHTSGLALPSGALVKSFFPSHHANLHRSDCWNHSAGCCDSTCRSCSLRVHSLSPLQ
ncbi:hypothetical protein BGZ63DRAFT_377939 [Mariannaea sp. PMI_226]|nr:hypothetical protein BGZ63DRAFT_377939 [Mariannaea sp. PMI_226]